ncbi:MAG TPA: phospholipase D-like domain-containing protein [Gemmatimonadales bacterium]|nr:phospholipase D-like domain-containing protein [Gemmatimonadales bacterium]
MPAKSRTGPRSRPALSSQARTRVVWGAGSAAVTAVLILLWSNLSSPAPPVAPTIRHTSAAGDSQFVRVMSSLLGPPMTGGNRVRTLLNGDECFPAMLSAIRSARRSIDFESYIYWSGQVGREFAAALSERARAGVPTHVLIDWAGSWVKADREVLNQMRAAGVEVVMYRPLRWYDLDRINNRTHRKLLIVDGRIGFTGGIGVADQWLGHAQDKDHWRDTHFVVEGPVVAQLQAAFLDNWIESEGHVLEGEAYFPPLPPVGQQLAQAFRSAPGEGSASMRLMYLLAIASATRSIRIANAYFVPDSVAVAMLVDARRRKVDVEIIVPGPVLDAQLVRRASRAMWGPLLEAGVRIYEYQPTMFHVKVMVVDDAWVSVGSTNFDDRSFRLNDEANLNVLDPGFALEQARVFNDDRGRSRQVTLEAWRHRSLWERLRERWAVTFRSQI